MPDPEVHYRMIGADNRQYGPITQTQLQDWIKNGRANGQTLVQVEGQTEWNPLATVSGFTDILSTSVAPPMIRNDDLRKSKLVAGLLGILLGSIGVHRFYLGYTEIGIAQILVTIITCGAGAVWGLIEGILIIVGSAITTDSDGRSLRE